MKYVAYITMSLFSLDVFAKELKSEHLLKPGDVLSADVLNEMFTNLIQLNKDPVEADLVGTWKCDSYTDQASSESEYQAIGAKDTFTLVPGWYTYQSGGDMTISDDEDGSYSITCGKQPFLFQKDYQGVQPYDFKVINGLIGFNFNEPAYSGAKFYTMEKLSSTRIRLKRFSGTGGIVTFMVCDKQDIAPENPEDAEISLSGDDVTISWSDKSNDEAGFVIVRKDSINGNWEEIGQTVANITSYKDTVPNRGTYWYRVKSRNLNGKSVGTNVIKVEVD